MDATLYYNPKCGTCRKVLEALQQRGVAVRTVEYLRNPPTEAEINRVLNLMGLEPENLVRKKEPLYQEKVAGRTLSHDEWLRVLHENPVLIERPILVLGERAAVIRPPEKLDEFLH